MFKTRHAEVAIVGYTPIFDSPCRPLLLPGGSVERDAAPDAACTILMSAQTFPSPINFPGAGVRLPARVGPSSANESAADEKVILRSNQFTETRVTPTPRELEVLTRAACAYSNQEIATELGISVRTVEVHKTKGMRRLGLAGPRALLQYARVHGWLENGLNNVPGPERTMEELQKIYASAINFSISTFRADRLELKLGDPGNGYVAEGHVGNAAEIIPWLQEHIKRHFPESEYARSLSNS